MIGNLGSKMSFVGLFMLGIGLFFFVSGIVRWAQSHDLEVGLLFLSLLFIVVGIWTHRAGREFRSVAETQGKDISHLMGALANLLKLYTLLYLLFFVALVFAIIQLGAHSLYGTRQDAARREPAGSIPGIERNRAAGFHVVKGHLELRPDRPRRRSVTSRSPAPRSSEPGLTTSRPAGLRYHMGWWVWPTTSRSQLKVAEIAPEDGGRM